MTTVSVVIPAFNAAPWIREAIDSALAQTMVPLEVIVVDDGSTDETATLLATYGTRIRIVTQTNKGVAAARNAGIDAFCGDWIAFLDADDVWDRRKLELQLQALQTDLSIGLLGTATFAWPESQPSAPSRGVHEMAPLACITRDALAVKNYLTTSSTLVRHDVVKSVGAFDTALCGPEDHDYWLRCADVTRVAVLRVPLTGYRSVSGSLSRRAPAMEAGMRRILHKLDACDFWRGQRLLRRHAYSYVSYSCAHLHGTGGHQLLAIRWLLASVLWYPFPYTRTEANVPFARARRLAVLLLRLLGLRRPDPGY
ncbi:MAG: glycosyltransferase [Phycisphaerae bacterium]|nr:glycosyltransferase [Phycisphaerae bacterium]